jgi:hypothetical protein
MFIVYLSLKLALRRRGACRHAPWRRLTLAPENLRKLRERRSYRANAEVDSVIEKELTDFSARPVWRSQTTRFWDELAILGEKVKGWHRGPDFFDSPICTYQFRMDRQHQ